VPSVIEALRSADRYHSSGDIQQAEAQYQGILRVEPGQPEALHALGVIALQLKKYEKAGSLIGKAIENKPKVPQFYYNLGLVFISLKRQERAIQAFQEAIKIKPDYADAYYNLGLALKKRQQFEEAVQNFKQVIKLTPDDAHAYYNLGNAYEALDRYEPSVENYQLAIKKNGAFAGAFNNLALVSKKMGRINEAINYFRKALRLQPALAEAHWNLSLSLLINGQFEEGWKEHEWRFIRGKRSTIYPHRFDIPLWDGSSFTGKRLFVHSEQGFGDTLQFIRYLPMVKCLGGTVIFEAFGPLLETMRGFPGIDKLVEISPDRRHVENCDYYVPLMSLPMLFATDIPTIPSNIPYIFADPEKAGRWKNRINKKGYKIGIVWAGKPEHQNDGNRSCALEYFSSLTEIPGVAIYGLQKGDAARQAETLDGMKRIINFDDELKDFSETAAAIENLDLVISVDTVLVHLAGAMGKPVWTLLPHAPDWRWLLEREDSPWYPTMRLFRQPEYGDWGAVFGKVKDELEKLVRDWMIGMYEHESSNQPIIQASSYHRHIVEPS
jgi:Flp pilus assembly protein TadD